MRSSTGGALQPIAKQRAAECKPLFSHKASMKQQAMVCQLAHAEASAYDSKRYFRRKDLSLMKFYREERESHERFKRLSAAGRIQALAERHAAGGPLAEREKQSRHPKPLPTYSTHSIRRSTRVQSARAPAMAIKAWLSARVSIRVSRKLTALQQVSSMLDQLLLLLLVERLHGDYRRGTDPDAA